MIGWGGMGGMPDWMNGSLVFEEEPRRRSLAGMISDAIRRWQQQKMITAMLAPACPVCGAEPAAWCDYRHPDFGPHTEMLQLDAELLICTARVQLAVDAHRVELGAILKRVPEWSPPPSLRTPGWQPSRTRTGDKNVT